MTTQEFAQKIVWLGHNTEGTSNKIWGYLQLGRGTPLLTFWGKRGGPWKFKPESEYSGGATASEMASKKQRDGYLPIHPMALGSSFISGLQSTLSQAVLADGFHNHPGA